MHIKFSHMDRVKDKNGNIKDTQIWNIATDAIINANLEKDGFEIKEGYIIIPKKDLTTLRNNYMIFC